MKRLLLLLFSSLLVVSMMIVGCKKSSSTDDPVQPTPQPTPPVEETAVIKYHVHTVIHTTAEDMILSPCFRANVSYKNADGEMVNVENVSLPWTSEEITVTKPFEALIEGKMLFNEEELPDTVVYGRLPSLYIDDQLMGLSFASMNMWGKENFLRMVTEHPDRLDFNYSRTIQ